MKKMKIGLFAMAILFAAGSALATTQRGDDPPVCDDPEERALIFQCPTQDLMTPCCYLDDELIEEHGPWVE